MTSLISRNVQTESHKTSIRLEQALWDGLTEICRREGWTVHEKIAVAQAAFPDRPRTSAVRSYLFRYFRLAATEAGLKAVGHGVRLRRWDRAGRAEQTAGRVGRQVGGETSAHSGTVLEAGFRDQPSAELRLDSRPELAFCSSPCRPPFPLMTEPSPWPAPCGPCAAGGSTCGAAAVTRRRTRCG